MFPPRPSPAIPTLSAGDKRPAGAAMHDAALEARIAAIAEDVRSKKDQYRGIEPHELAELLGIVTSWHPDGEWQRVRFHRHVPFEECIEWKGPEGCLYLLKEHVPKTRYAELEAEADAISAGTKNSRALF